jgi:hypothetical protein
MTITADGQLIVEIDGRTRLISKEQIIKAFVEPRAACANYERDNYEDPLINLNKELVMTSELNTKDPIVESVRTKLLDRSQVGIKKYGTTIWDNTDENYIKHLQDELLDGANYCEQKLRLGEFTAKVAKIMDTETNYFVIGELISKEYNKLKYGN